MRTTKTEPQADLFAFVQFHSIWRCHDYTLDGKLDVFPFSDPEGYDLLKLCDWEVFRSELRLRVGQVCLCSRAAASFTFCSRFACRIFLFAFRAESIVQSTSGTC